MSILDDKLDVSYTDVIRNLVIKYLKSNTPYKTNINLMDGFYCFDENGKTMIEYDGNPENWYIVFKLFTTPVYVYIAKYPYTTIKSEHNLGFVRSKPELIPITLKNILKQSIKDSNNS